MLRRRGHSRCSGVCLGHQALGEVFGGTVAHAPELMHGKTSQVEHDGDGVLDGLPSPFTATRYHSLAVSRTPCPTSSRSPGTPASGVVMALQHRELPLFGVQFHPESVLTEGGHRLLANWLRGLRRRRGGRPLRRAGPARPALTHDERAGTRRGGTARSAPG